MTKVLLTTKAVTEIFTLIIIIQTEFAKSIKINNTDCKQFTFFNTADAWFHNSLFTKHHKSHFKIDWSVVLEFTFITKQNRALDWQKSQFDYKIKFINMRKRQSFHYSHNIIQIKKINHCELDREQNDNLQDQDIDSRDCRHDNKVCR